MPRPYVPKRAALAPVPDPVARRIRERRIERGLSLARLASSVGTSISVSYLSLIENGHKVPDEAKAVAIADALGDDRKLYRAWVRARKQSHLDVAIEAAETLKSWAAAHPTVAQANEPIAETASPRSTREASAPGASASSHPSITRIRIPVIPSGLDPGDSLRPTCTVLEWRRLDAERLGGEYRERLDRPFAIRLDRDAVRRVPARFALGPHALVLRAFLPIMDDRVYAVRRDGRLELHRALWNGSQLVLLPAEGASDFVVIDAAGEPALRALVLGVAIAVDFDQEDAPA